MAHTKWVLDPTHSELGFKIKHLMITNVSGVFTNFQVAAESNGDDFKSASFNVQVQLDSINTNNAQRDAHLRNSDFFEVDKYPELLFHSTKTEPIDADNFYLYGDLSLKGVTKPVKLTVEHSGTTKDPWGGERAGFVVTGKINRNEWGVSFNGALETGGLMLGEEVKIHSEVQLVKVAAAVAA